MKACDRNGANHQALEGIRVLDLSQLLPGPFASMMLADLGAEVIKVEEPKLGDPARRRFAVFLQVNRNKKSLALDLKREPGREIFLKLASGADVVLEQFRPGVVDRLKLGYSVIREINPQVVYCSLSGYGQTGPYRERAGHDLNYIALAGLLSLTADERGRPVIPGTQIADLAGGSIAAFAILAALFARERTGQGQFIDVSMFDSVMLHLIVPAAHHFAGARIGFGSKYELSGAYPFYNVYETSDGKFMSLGALEPRFWENFCRRVGRPDLIARQFDSGKQRDELFEQMRAIFKSRTQAEWIELMRDVDACCEPVLSLAEALEQAQVRARAMVQEIQRPAEGIIRQLGFAYKLSGTSARWVRPAPALGQHTDELLAELGIPEADRQRLYREGVARTASN
jgi:crotonobetainyl-CoA:carnitine CoA-transferase CaiB-like acyl-CoA transferase